MTERQSFTFRREAETVRAARGVLDAFEQRLPPEVLYDASVCLSELVSNAIQHPGGGSELELTVAYGDQGLRVEVTDPGPGFELDAPLGGDERGGWGLFIVDQLSTRWGVESGPPTVAWFEMAGADEAGDEASVAA